MKSKAKFSPAHYLDQLIVHVDALEKQKKKVSSLMVVIAAFYSQSLKETFLDTPPPEIVA